MIRAGAANTSSLTDGEARMALVGDRFGYWLLKTCFPPNLPKTLGSIRSDGGELVRLFGSDFLEQIPGKTVIDFGCGSGGQSVEIAIAGAARVVGLDIQVNRLAAARRHAARSGVGDRCVFSTSTNEQADVILSKDAFEHFEDVPAVLIEMHRLLKATGCVWASFGPTWLHPYGGHLFSVFPWAHLLFAEKTLIRWRSDFKADGATRFSEVEGGLNQLTIRKFEQYVSESPLQIDRLELVPIRGLRFLARPIFREYGSSIVRCRLLPKCPKLPDRRPL